MKETMSIEELEEGVFDIYNESGQCIEMGFHSQQDAEIWLIDNDYIPY